MTSVESFFIVFLFVNFIIGLTEFLIRKYSQDI